MLYFVAYETGGSAGHFRTVINQLLSFLYGAVRMFLLLKQTLFHRNLLIPFWKKDNTNFWNLQGAFYGIVLRGLQSIRVWFGPLPFIICRFEIWSSMFMNWYIVLIMFSICCIKFMFVCIWKRMRDMNDKLIARIILRWAIFIRSGK